MTPPNHDAAFARRVIFRPRGFGQLHRRGTESARTVETDDLVKTRIAIKTAWKQQGLVALIGEPGLGKTLAAGTAIAQLGLLPCYAHIPPRPKDKEFEEALLDAVTDGAYDTRNTRATERRDLAQVGRTHEFVFTLDDIERAEGYGIELVRYVWDQAANRVTYVLAGNHLDRFLAANPALDSRVARYVHFSPWTVGQAKLYLPQYHDLFARATPAVIEYAFREFAHGFFRNWARLLEALLANLKRPDQPLTRSLVDEAISLINQE